MYSIYSLRPIRKSKNKIKMKKIYTLLLMVLAIPMSTMAQQITHRFPALTIKYIKSDGTDSGTYTLAAWDALTADGLRVQATTQPEEETVPEGGGWDSGGGGVPDDGIIVTGVGNQAKILRAPRHAEGKIVAGHVCSYSTDNSSNQNTPLLAIFNNKIKVSYGGTVRKTTESAEESWNLTYGDILTQEEMPDETMREQRLFIEVNDFYISGDYVVPTTADDSKFAEAGNVTTINITAIGNYVFYNRYPRTEAQIANMNHEPFMRATSVTIPAQIKSIGKRCFYGAGFLEKVTIADNSEISEIPYYCFARCLSLREINIPASVNTISYGAFCACPLGKIQFASTTTKSPTMDGSVFMTMNHHPAIDMNNCAVWVNSLETVRAFYNNSIWDKFAFSVPFELKKEMVTYSSDLPLSAKSLQLGTGFGSNDPTANDQTNPNPNTWVLDTDADSLKMYYVSQSKTNLNPQIQNGQRTISMTQLPTDLAVKEFGVILSGKPGVHPLYIKPKLKNNGNALGPTTYSNYLVGTRESTPWFEDADNFLYLLKDGKFYIWGSGNIAANKAYLKLPKNLFDDIHTAKELNIVIGEEEGETDGIKAIDNSQLRIEIGVVYDLQGRVVSTNGMEALPKGIYIMNGKKYVFN